MSMHLLSFAHLSFCFFVVYSAGFLFFRCKKYSLLAFTVVFFILVDSVGLVVSPYLDLENIKYLTNPYFLINKGQLSLYTKQIFAHWIFLSVSLVGILLEMSVHPKKVNVNLYLDKKLIKVFALLLFIAGIISYVRYFVFGPGLYLLLTTNIFFSSTTEAISSRSIVRSLVHLRTGSYVASISSVIFFPISAALFLRVLDKNKWIVFWICSFLSFAYAFQTRQKGPLVFWFITYLLLFEIEKYSYKFNSYEKGFLVSNKIILNSATAAVFAVIILYIVNFGQNIFDALQSTLARIFIIPGAVENYYFAVFPKIYSYRGISRIFSIPLGYVRTQAISIYDVAEAATRGNRFSANASFMAIAWSGAGYLGVFIVSITLVFVLILIDGGLEKSLDRRGYLEVTALSMYSLVGLSSGSLMDYINKGGIVIPFITIFIFSLARSYPSRRLKK